MDHQPAQMDATGARGGRGRGHSRGSGRGRGRGHDRNATQGNQDGLQVDKSSAGPGIPFDRTASNRVSEPRKSIQEASLGFEDQVRSMILRDMPDQTGSSISPAVMPGPGHTQPGVRPTGENKTEKPRHRRPTQAERRQGRSNKLDLSGPQISSDYQGQQKTAQGNNAAANMISNDRGPRISQPPISINSDGTTSFGSRNQFASPPTSPASYRQQHQHPGRMPVYNTFGRVPLYGGPEPGHMSGYPASGSDHHQLYAPNVAPGFRSANQQSFAPQRQGRMDVVPLQRQAEYLEHLAGSHVPQIAISNDEASGYQHLQEHLSHIIAQALRASEDTSSVPENSIRLECFGSLASGFAMRKSDMDLMLFYDDTSLTEEQSAHVPRLVEKALLDQNHGARLLTRTRIPIIRFCASPTQELLSALRSERAKWEEEKDKEPEKKADDNSNEADGDHDEDHDNHDDNDDDQDASEDEKEDPTVTEDGLRSPKSDTAIANDAGVNGGAAPGRPKKKAGGKKKARKTKDESQPKEPGPPPYKNDEERASLYQLAIKEDWYDHQERLLIRTFIESLKLANGNVNDERLVAARSALDSLPDVLSRYREPRVRKKELEYPEDSGLLCDINFSVGKYSNALGVHNTRLLRCYSLFDPRIRDMVIFVKGWAKSRKINKAYHGTLSSYGYVLMVLHYVVNIAHPPLAPNLQIHHHRNSWTGYSAPETCGTWDIRFWQDPEAITQAARLEWGMNVQSLGSLLAGFFRYYAVSSFRGASGFEWMKEVISLRTLGGILSKEQKNWTGKWIQTSEAETAAEKPREIQHRYLVAIEDPFEHSHNVGRPVVHHGIVAIREEFRRANDMIVSGGFWRGIPQGFFDEGVLYERAAPRFFGPNPKHRKAKPPAQGPKKPAGEAKEKAQEKAQEKIAAQPGAPKTGGAVGQGAKGSQATATATASRNPGPDAGAEVKKQDFSQ